MHQASRIHVRPFEPTDAEYRAVAEFLNVTDPDRRRPATVEAIKEQEADWEEGYLRQRYVLEEINSLGEAERLLLIGNVWEAFWAYELGEVHLNFNMDPGMAGKGIEDLFFAYVVEKLLARKPKLERLLIGVMEDKADRIAYIESNGFTVRERDAKSALILQNADLSPLAGLEDAALADGIRIYTLAQVKELVPDWNVQLHQLRCALDRDVPGAGPKMETTLEQFERMFLQDPALDPEAWWIAVDESGIQTPPPEEPASSDAALHNDRLPSNECEDRKHDNSTNLGIAPSQRAVANSSDVANAASTSQRFGEREIGQFIGYSNLWINDETRKRLDTGMTGVLRSHRRRGIATLLKHKAIAYGKRHNSERIVTSNEENNPMLDLNYKLGFKPIPGWIRYEKIFQTEQEQQEKSAAQGQRATSQPA